MNKAFTANINDQVTARGYLDENDQLIMLEPEGSGGGGDVSATLATITIDTPAGKSFSIPAVVGGIFASVNITIPIRNESVVMFNGRLLIYTDGSDEWNPERFVYTGGLSSDEDWNIIVTGSGTMTAVE